MVVESPSYLLIRHLVKHRLLHLCLEYLAVLAGALRQCLKLRGLHIEFGGSATHAYEHGALGYVGDATFHVAHGFAVYRHYIHSAVFALRHHIEHEVELRFAGAVVALHALHQYGVANVEYGIVVGVKWCSHIRLIGKTARWSLHGSLQGGRRRLGVDIIIVYHHAPATL